MALLDEQFLRSVARSRAANLRESVTDSLNKSMSATAQLSAFHIFLSHSFLDKELILGITTHFERLGYTVYVDWKVDAEVTHDHVTKDNAEVVRRRLMQSKSLFYAHTKNASGSKWMPWELGYMDGKNHRSAILPIAAAATPSNAYAGQDYLGIYPHIIRQDDTSGRERLWVYEDAQTYVTFDAWLEGKEPYQH